MSAPPTPTNFFKTACLFEGSLILVAMVIGWFTDVNPFASLYYTETDLALGLLATLPLVMLFLVLYHSPLASLQAIKATLLQTLGPLMCRCHWSDLLILAAIAGISEELLFRGVLQPWIENHWGMSAGLIVSNIIFGLVHAITPMYAFLAASVGIYLGLLLDFGEQRNLIIPIVTHGFYDFIAFLVIMRAYRAQQANAESDHD